MPIFEASIQDCDNNLVCPWGQGLWAGQMGYDDRKKSQRSWKGTLSGGGDLHLFRAF